MGNRAGTGAGPAYAPKAQDGERGFGYEHRQKDRDLTSGGDSPGMNAAVVSVARCASDKAFQLMGIKRGYNGRWA
jgi:hypothetical protein